MQALSSWQTISSGVLPADFGAPVRRTLLVLVLNLVVAPFSGAASTPVDCAHLLGWLAGGASTYALTKVLESRGVGFFLTLVVKNQLAAAGVSRELFDLWKKFEHQVAQPGTCPASLAKAATDAHNKQFDTTEQTIATQLASDPQNATLHFALGYIDQQEGL